MGSADVSAETGTFAQQRTRARLVLAGLFALFFIPILGAILVAVVAPHWIPFGRVNHGELLRPAVADALQAMTPLDGGGPLTRGPSQPWVIAHLGGASCDENCEYALVQMRQARLALGKDAHRVERWWLVTQRPDAGRLSRVLEKFPGLRIGLVQKQSPIFIHATIPVALYMVDPMGFLVLKYSHDGSQLAEASAPNSTLATRSAPELASALRKDFKRLLKLSRQR